MGQMLTSHRGQGSGVWRGIWAGVAAGRVPAPPGISGDRGEPGRARRGLRAAPLPLDDLPLLRDAGRVSCWGLASLALSQGGGAGWGGSRPLGL